MQLPADVELPPYGLTEAVPRRRFRACSTGNTSSATRSWRGCTRRASACSGTRRPTSTGRSTSIPERPGIDDHESMDAILQPPERLDTQDAPPHEPAHRRLDAVAVHARRAGRAAGDRADRQHRAVDRGEVLRRQPGGGRSAPRRGVSPLPDREVGRDLSGQPAPAHAAQSDHRRVALGHDLPRHADHGGRPGARRLRLDEVHQGRRAADPADHRRGHARRGTPRRLRRPLAAGPLHQGAVVDRAARARGVRHRGDRADARSPADGRGVAAHRARREVLDAVGADARRSWSASARSSSRRSCPT